ncbi:MAG: Asp23/Gls24 family envelope stress response protein [Actinomycetia bacterium]|nr:Asp23/Gls24 family envelope stress response protein [Actinomycetes bacterium]
MSEQFSSEGLTIAPGVIETILAQTVLQVDGVTQVGGTKTNSSLLGLGGKNKTTGQGIILLAENDQLTVTVHVRVAYGYRLQEVAAQIRQTISETLAGQIGIMAAAVDVYVDSIAFPQE